MLHDRDTHLGPVERELGRRLKRVLADEQNEVFDLLRRDRPARLDDVVPAADEHARRYAAAALADLDVAALSGAASVDREVTGSCSALASELGESLVEPMRERIARSLDECEGDLEEVTERLRSLYREWKGQRIGAAVRHYAAAAYAWGLYEATPSDAELRWLVDRTGEACPDADDNALASGVHKGDAFPTGVLCSPAHPDCRCLVVPVGVGSRAHRVRIRPEVTGRAANRPNDLSVGSAPMRAPDDLPRRAPRRKNGRRGRTILIVAVIAAFILLTSLRGIAGFYTDYLWFDSLDQSGVWRGILGAKLSLALIFMVGFFLLSWANLLIADRIAPPFRLAGPEDELLERYHDIVDDRMGWLRIVICVLLALIAGSGVSSEWNSWVLFTHGGDFGIEDPQFHNDVGFYVFRLPFLSFVVDWLFASLLIVIIVTAVAHYLNGGIRVQPPSPRVTPQVKAHLSVLLAVLALVKAADYWLQRFELTTSTRGIVDGASYTDVKAQLPALNLLVLISLCAAALFVVNIFRRGWALPVVAVGLWVFVAIVAGGIYPQYVQRFQVQPNESARERPYIAAQHRGDQGRVRTWPTSPSSASNRRPTPTTCSSPARNRPSATSACGIRPPACRARRSSSCSGSATSTTSTTSTLTGTRSTASPHR